MAKYKFTGNGLDAPNDAKLVCGYNTAGPYEVEEGNLHLLSDGRFYFRYASGC